MSLFDFERLLDPAPMPLEMGYERLSNGVLHVACRTDMQACSGDMLQWWFRSRPNSQQYRWWHPTDHVSSDWFEYTEGTHIGSIHKVEERFSGGPIERLLIQFRNCDEFVSRQSLDLALSSKAISAMICARGGQSWDAPRDQTGRIMGARLLHVARDTHWGCVLRSHFFLGFDLPTIGKSAAQIGEMLPDTVGQALLGHCYTEFMHLSKFLPSLYIAEHRDDVLPKPLW
jgi:hypothetical protein